MHARCPKSVVYGSGKFSGNEFTDTVTLGSGLTVQRQSIGVASSSQGFAGTIVDGLLGYEINDGIRMCPLTT